MASRQDVRKQRSWEERLGRYQASGLTVARFCANEGVSVNTFYYWARRVRSEVTTTASIAPSNEAGRGRGRGKHVDVAANHSSPALVRFQFHAAVEVFVPAHCFEALRCLMECVQQARPESAGAFREVLVGAR